VPVFPEGVLRTMVGASECVQVFEVRAQIYGINQCSLSIQLDYDDVSDAMTGILIKLPIQELVLVISSK
jgi:hypothetical protein